MRSFNKILVTGGAGFIGSHVIRHLISYHSSISVVNLDALTYAGNLENLSDIQDSCRYTFVKGNICNVDLVSSLFKEHNFDAVIHLVRCFESENVQHVNNKVNPVEDLETIKTEIALSDIETVQKKT